MSSVFWKWQKFSSSIYVWFLPNNTEKRMNTLTIVISILVCWSFLFLIVTFMSYLILYWSPIIYTFFYLKQKHLSQEDCGPFTNIKYLDWFDDFFLQCQQLSEQLWHLCPIQDRKQQNARCSQPIKKVYNMFSADKLHNLG